MNPGEFAMNYLRKKPPEESRDRTKERSKDSFDEALNCGKIKYGRMEVTEDEMCQSMEDDLIRYEKAGIPIYICGKRRSAKTAAVTTMLRENGNYTCSYRYDSEGHLGLYFELFSEKEKDG